MKNLSLKAKMLLVSAALLTVISTTSIFFFKELYQASTRMKRIDDATALLDAVDTQFDIMTIGMRGYLLNPSRQEEWASKTKADEIATRYLDKLKDFKEFPEILQAIDEMAELDAKSLNRLENEFGELVDQKKTDAANEFYFKKYMPVKAKMNTILSEAMGSANQEREEMGLYQQKILVTGGTILFGIIFMSLVFSFIYNQRLASKITTSIQSLTEKLNTSVLSIELASKNTASASQQIATSATENASAITETLSISESGKRESDRGKNVVSRMADSMAQVADSNSRLETLIKVIEDIQSKTKVINDIVFETRLLSFNASIEAARAGVHGKGFAVVAEEVGKLAAVSGKAAEEINTLLANSTHHVKDIVSTTGQRVSVAKDYSQQCEQVFEQMSHAMSEINRAMADMERETHHNSASSEEMANQAQTLSLEARSLTGLLAKLRAVVSGQEQKGDLSTPDVSLPFERHVNSTPQAMPLKPQSASPAFEPVNGTLSTGGKPLSHSATSGSDTEMSQDDLVDRSDSRWKTAA